MQPRFGAAVFCVLALLWIGQATSHADSPAPATEAGHSLHGEAFDEGPRQKGPMIPNTGKVRIKITTHQSEAQALFNQGLGQLEGFWYFEAERSFRQAASLDTNCAMAYWGMAMANVNNGKRATEFIKRADESKAQASPRETMWIEAYRKYFSDKGSENDRRKELVLSLEKIVQKYPNELEAKTLLAFQIWENETKGISMESRQAVDSLINEVLAQEPLHPIHHARIHLWNDKQDKVALTSAARCGQSAPGIAHMWHMPGHTYSALKRFDDAAWQQEAAARTDHAYMMASRILPDQIHNFAHNNQWLCTDLLYCGRVHEAIELSKNMIELPRHPKFNTLNRKEDHSSYAKNNGSSMLGRSRLLDALIQFEMWDDILGLADTMYLEPTDLPEEQAQRLYVIALAHFARGESADSARNSLESCRKQLKQERFEAAEKAEQSAKKDKKETTDAMAAAMKAFSGRLERVEKYSDELEIWSALASGKTNEAKTLLDEAKELPKARQAILWGELNQQTNCVKLAEELARSATNQAPELALAAKLCWQAGNQKAATRIFQQLRGISSAFDLDAPLLAKLAPIAKSLELPKDWRKPAKKRSDVGRRPSLETLGPFRWSPYAAPGFKLATKEGKSFSLSEARGGPVLLVFYLGGGCSHCLQQLNLLSKSSDEFNKQGIRIVAVSCEPSKAVKVAADEQKEPEFPFPILQDKTLKTFKDYRVYDDFEQMPLHGTFLVDGSGKVRWQDISFDPFEDVKFILGESRRLISLGNGADLAKR